MSLKKQLCIRLTADLMDFFNKKVDNYYKNTGKQQISIESNKIKTKYIIEALEYYREWCLEQEDE